MSRVSLRSWPLAAAALTLGLGSFSAHAGQIVARDLAPLGKVKPSLTASLTPVLLHELSRIDGISVVSQGDVRALLNHQADREGLGCDEDSCFTTIADSMGAEMMLSATMGRVGRKWVVALTLFQTDAAKVIRRANGEATGGVAQAEEAVRAAVLNLFREGIPEDVAGPASMSRLGFKAAVLGLSETIATNPAAAAPHRKRIIADLVNTELDYDTKPKLEELGWAIRRGYGNLKVQSLVAKTPAEHARRVAGMEMWVAIERDVERVKEIRERARQRGTVPSMSPLRFSVPDPLQNVAASEDIDAYKKDSKAARATVKKALKHWRKKQKKAYLAMWKPEELSRGEREFKDRDSQKRYHYTYDLLPMHALPAWDLKWIVGDLKSNAVKVGDGRAQPIMIVLVRRYTRGKIDSTSRVRLEKNKKGKWQITSWF